MWIRTPQNDIQEDLPEFIAVMNKRKIEEPTIDESNITIITSIKE